MSIFQQTLEQSDERFLRDVGISKATFQQLLDKVATYLAVQREKNPMKKRGLKSTISIADQLLLTLTYLRHYPTFAKLGKEFSISGQQDLSPNARHSGSRFANEQQERITP